MDEREIDGDGVLEGRLSNPGGIPVGPCSHCEREVVGWMGGDGGEAFSCSHCDLPLRAVTWVEEEQLAAMGYDLWDPLAAGCAGGCAKGGCAPRR